MWRCKKDDCQQRWPRNEMVWSQGVNFSLGLMRCITCGACEMPLRGKGDALQRSVELHLRCM